MERSGNVKQTLMQIVDRKKQAAKEQAQLAATQIIVNASSGIGYEGDALKPYSAVYREMRLARGYSPNVNLTLTGQMLRDVQADVVSKSAAHLKTRIYVASGSSISPFDTQGLAVASTEKARYTNKTRPWFGLSQKARGNIIDNIKGA